MKCNWLPRNRNRPWVADDERSPDLVADQFGPVVSNTGPRPYHVDHFRGVDTLAGRCPGRVGKGDLQQLSRTACWLSLLADRPGGSRAGPCRGGRLARLRSGRGSHLAAGKPGRALPFAPFQRARAGRHWPDLVTSGACGPGDVRWGLPVRSRSFRLDPVRQRVDRLP